MVVLAQIVVVLDWWGVLVPARIDSLSGRIKAHRVLDKLKQPESNDHETCPLPPKVFDALTRLQRERERTRTSCAPPRSRTKDDDEARTIHAAPS